MLNQLHTQKPPSDRFFDSIYPARYHQHSARHFTPVNVAWQAARYLAQTPEDKILDIGSGTGKFCIAASLISQAHFYGVEMRKTLTNLSNRVKRAHGLKNAHFINADFGTIDFSRFDGIYFFNSFHEFCDASCVLDEQSKVSLETYKAFHELLKQKLNECKPGTRLVTYYTFKNKIPSSFRFVRSSKKGLLKFYVKK